MNILYVASKYHSGQKDQGFSHEHYNFFDTLKRLGFNIVHFDPLILGQKYGRRKANTLLLEVEKSEQFDLMFTCLYTDQLDFEVVERITSRGNCITYNWFCDDRWRFNNYSCLWAPCFRWVSTTDEEAVQRYNAIGYENIIKTQWAYNHFRHTDVDTLIKYDVTFVGQKYGDREAIINNLRHHGIKVNTWGGGWPEGKVSQEKMNTIFGQSRINLNPSKVYGNRDARIFTLRDRRYIEKHLRHVSAEDALRRHLPSKASKAITVGSKLMRGVTNSRTSRAAGYYPAAAGPMATPLTDIKARTFEVPSCGGFLLTGYTPGLEHYYDLDKEIVSFSTDEEIIAIIKHYLEHEEKRAEVALAGYQRTLNDHTYVQRFNKIFGAMGLSFPALDVALGGRITSGDISEVC